MTSVMQCCPTDQLVGVSPLLPCLDDPVFLRVEVTAPKRPKVHVTPSLTGIEDISDEVLAVVLDQKFQFSRTLLVVSGLVAVQTTCGRSNMLPAHA